LLLKEIIDKALSFTIKERRELNSVVLYASQLHIRPEIILKQIKLKNKYEIKSFSSSMGKIIEEEAINLISVWLRKYSTVNNPIYYKKQKPIRLTDLNTKTVISGNIDLLVYLPDQIIPIEIKSVGKEEFESYSIKTKYKIQLLTYMLSINVSNGLLLIINRDNGKWKIIDVYIENKIYSCVLKDKVRIEEHIKAYLNEFDRFRKEELHHES